MEKRIDKLKGTIRTHKQNKNQGAKTIVLDENTIEKMVEYMSKEAGAGKDEQSILKGYVTGMLKAAMG